MNNCHYGYDDNNVLPVAILHLFARVMDFLLLRDKFKVFSELGRKGPESYFRVDSLTYLYWTFICQFEMLNFQDFLGEHAPISL